MKKIVSNDDIMDIFREIEDIKASNISKEKISEMVKEKHDEIVESLSFLIYKKTRLYKKFSNYEDLIQEGFIGLIKAVQRFDHTRFPNFFVYSNQWINHYIKRAASRFDIVYNPNKNRVIYCEPSDEDADPKPCPDEELYNKERVERVSNIINNFADREREIICALFGLDQEKKTLRELSPKFGISHERIRQIKNDILDRLKKNKELSELNNDFNT